MFIKIKDALFNTDAIIRISKAVCIPSIKVQGIGIGLEVVNYSNSKERDEAFNLLEPQLTPCMLPVQSYSPINDWERQEYEDLIEENKRLEKENTALRDNFETIKKQYESELEKNKADYEKEIDNILNQNFELQEQLQDEINKQPMVSKGELVKAIYGNDPLMLVRKETILTEVLKVLKDQGIDVW